MEKKDYKQLGAYGILIKDEKILLIKKNGGPYDGKFDLPGGTIEFNEKPNEALVREFNEEVGIQINKYELFDANSVSFEWKFNGMLINVYHIGIFYKIFDYSNEIKTVVDIDQQNDDSLGANFYDICSLKREQLSAIAILELEGLGYKLK